jgi:hypothetical protein
MLKTTFLDDPVPVDGMPELYASLARVTFHMSPVPCSRFILSYMILSTLPILLQRDRYFCAILPI